MKSGVDLIAEARQQQIDKYNHPPEHDVEHPHAGLNRMDVSYTYGSSSKGPPMDISLKKYYKKNDGQGPVDISKLALAGALIAAEIDRLQATEGSECDELL